MHKVFDHMEHMADKNRYHMVSLLVQPNPCAEGRGGPGGEGGHLITGPVMQQHKFR